MKTRKLGRLLTILGCFLLCGCTKAGLKSEIYSGKSGNWNITYELNENNDCFDKKGYSLNMKYIGNDTVPDRLEYSIHHISGDVPISEGAFSREGCFSGSGALEFETIVKWNNESETIPLTSN